jgi:hypothetical protein
MDSANFVIPELPSGRMLVFNILSTWGDPYYVGLMGIEVFDRSGHLVALSNVERQLWAEPPDINILAEYGIYSFALTDKVKLTIFSFQKTIPGPWTIFWTA